MHRKAYPVDMYKVKTQTKAPLIRELSEKKGIIENLKHTLNHEHMIHDTKSALSITKRNDQFDVSTGDVKKVKKKVVKNKGKHKQKPNVEGEEGSKKRVYETLDEEPEDLGVVEEENAENEENEQVEMEEIVIEEEEDDIELPEDDRKLKPSKK